jgi:hypothetical protein
MKHIRKASAHSAFSTESQSGSAKIRKPGFGCKPTPEISMEAAARNPFATFCEWAGDADEKAYADL